MPSATRDIPGNWIVTAAILVVLAGCSDEASGQQGRGDEEANSSAATTPNEVGPFRGWDLAARKRAWNGAWVLEAGGIEQWQAWDVKDGAVTTWDGNEERKEKLDVETPCTFGITGPKGGYESHYTVHQGKVMAGLGAAGSRRGKEAIACISNAIFTLDAEGQCLRWTERFDKYESSPGTCGIIQEGDREYFTAELHGSTERVPIYGEAILSDQLKGTHSERQADFAAAKAARDKKKSE